MRNSTSNILLFISKWFIQKLRHYLCKYGVIFVHMIIQGEECSMHVSECSRSSQMRRRSIGILRNLDYVFDLPKIKLIKIYISSRWNMHKELDLFSKNFVQIRKKASIIFYWVEKIWGHMVNWMTSFMRYPFWRILTSRIKHTFGVKMTYVIHLWIQFSLNSMHFFTWYK